MKTTAAEAIAALAGSEATLLSGVELRSRARRAAASPTGLVSGEPLYTEEEADDVQGNIVPGFNKDHQEFLFLRFDDGLSGAREWLSWLAPKLASMEEVLHFRAEFRALRLRLGVREPGMSSTWTCVAFSHDGLRALVGDEAAAFGDHSFRQGLSARADYLGDPTDPAHRGHPSRWVVGGPDNEARRAGDRGCGPRGRPRPSGRGGPRRSRWARADVHLPSNAATPAGTAGRPRALRLQGRRLPTRCAGAPGRAGRLPQPSLLVAEDDPHADLFAKPGQPLVWPGQFLLGESRQDPQDPLQPAAAAATFPAWAARGSYLVCRRLRQDVVAFWDFAASVAERLDLPPVNVRVDAVGRWPSGAPLLRTPAGDDLELAGDEFANNHFLFDDETRPSVLEGIEGYGGDQHPRAAGDVFGHICPHAAHIRKVNPRDSATDFGAPADTVMRLMLRRGIPFGAPIAGRRIRLPTW